MPRSRKVITPKPDALPVPTGERYTGAVRVMSPEPANAGATELLRLQALDRTPRPRWEYRVAVSEDGQSYYLRDQGHYEGRPATSVHFNDLGLQGWELVTIYPVGDAMHAPIYYAVFKRPIQDA